MSSSTIITFKSVLHVPQIQSNLLSVLKLTKDKVAVVKIEDNKMSFLEPETGKLLFTSTAKQGLPKLDGFVIHPQSALLISSKPRRITKDLLHRRLCHAGKERIEKMITGEMVKDIPKIDEDTRFKEICEPCLAGKMTRLPFPKKSQTVIKRRGDLIVTDLKECNVFDKRVCQTSEFATLNKIYQLSHIEIIT